MTQDTITTKIPARLDRLPWSRWHWYIVMALGTVWILDGLEVTMKGSVGPAVRDNLGLTSGQIGKVAAIYVFGSISGALFWGYLTDRTGRKKLFLLTLSVYMAGVLLTTVSWGFWSFAGFRFLTGFGIGGEYAAVNSAVDELIPARTRGWADVAINGSYWFGGAVAAGLSLLYLNLLPADYGWRAGFATGAVLAVGILALRRAVPESPRWLITHGQEEEADAILDDIEQRVIEDEGVDGLDEPPDSSAIELRERRSMGFIELGRTMFKLYPRRSTVGLALMGTQAFLYNAIFFTYGLILTTFYGVSTSSVGIFMVPFAVGNLLGPLLLGRFFDTVGRRPMISGTYILAGVLTIGLGFAFTNEWLGATGMTIGWVVIFFFASAGSSAGYLTVSETFPLEIRAMAIAFFYAIATAAGGIVGPWLFGNLIGSGNDRGAVFLGYLIGAGLMIAGGATELVWGVAAEQKSLEDIAMPLSASEQDEGDQVDTVSHAGPLGVDPADPESIRAFQREHDLEDDGVLGPRTQGALRAEYAGLDDDAERGWMIDVTDPQAVVDFQQRFALEPDGVVGPETAGALAFARRVVDVDPTVVAEVMALQHSAGLEPDGDIGPRTQVVLAALSQQLTEDEGVGPELLLTADLDDVDGVAAFQRSVGLEDDGIIGPVTRGALRAARHFGWRRAGVEVSDAEAVRRFQQAAGLSADGVVGPATRSAIVALRDAWLAGARQQDLLDVLDEQAVKAFQRQHDLDETGAVDEATQQAARFEHDHYFGIDPAHAESIAAFQRRNGLTADGILGPATQGALRALRTDRDIPDDDEREDRYGRFSRSEFEHEGAEIDPADPESIRTFQTAHGLEPDGIVGSRTQLALRTVGAGTPHARQGPERASQPYHRRLMGSGLMSATTVPSRDIDLDREIDEIVASLADGPRSKSDVATDLHARRWGPGRFRQAVRVATEEGRLEEAGHDRIALHR